MEKKYICPVCGFDGLDEEPYWNNDPSVPSYNICGCCGCEFGCDFENHKKCYSVEQWRKEFWIDKNYRWALPKYKPQNWSLEKQLKNLEREDIKKLIRDINNFNGIK